MSQRPKHNVERDEVLELHTTGGKFPYYGKSIIRQAVTLFNEETLTEMVYLMVEIPEFKKIYEIAPICINTKDNQPFVIKQRNMIANALYLANPNMDSSSIWDISDLPSEMFDYNTGKKEIASRPQYINLLNKEFNMVISMNKTFGEILVNAYSGKPIPSKKENQSAYEIALTLPQTIRIPDYSKQPKISFEIKAFFGLDDKSLKESLSGLSAEEYKYYIENKEKIQYVEPILTGEAFIKKVHDILVKSCKKHGVTPDEAQFEKFKEAQRTKEADANYAQQSSGSTNVSSDVPF